jgi:prepilin-type N-terminal cleavage/methylation domain-containing protein
MKLSKSQKNLLLKTGAGFTLIEILLAVVILTTISAFGVASFNNASRANEVQQKSQEVKSIARKLRTDASAATKPNNTSCQSNGTFYGTYLTLVKNTDQYHSGISCFDSAGNDTLGAPGAVNLNLNLDHAYSNNLIIFYSFDGQVYFFNSPAIRPTKALIDAPTTSINPQPVNVSATVTKNNISYQVWFSGTGLVCEQKSPVTAVPCVQ